MKVLLLLPLLLCVVVAIPDRQPRSAHAAAPKPAANHAAAAPKPASHAAAAPKPAASHPAAAPKPTASHPAAGPKPTAGHPAAGPKPAASHQTVVAPAAHPVPHVGCDYVAFSDVAFTVVDVVATGSFPTPASCISYLVANQATIKAVEYNYPTCRAVKNVTLEHTTHNTNAIIFMMRPNPSASAASLAWFTTFVELYEITYLLFGSYEVVHTATANQTHVVIDHPAVPLPLIHPIEVYATEIKAVPITLQDHCKTVVAHTINTKVTVVQAAQKVHTQLVQTGKIDTAYHDFNTFWGVVGDACQKAVKNVGTAAKNLAKTLG